MTLEEIQAELEAIRLELDTAAHDCANASMKATELAADYEELKQKCLLALYDDEAERKIKRTVDQRIAIYRTKYAVERRAKMLAEAGYNAAKQFSDHLKAKAMILQTLAGIEKEKMRLI